MGNCGSTPTDASKSISPASPPPAENGTGSAGPVKVAEKQEPEPVQSGGGEQSQDAVEKAGGNVGQVPQVPEWAPPRVNDLSR